MMTTMKEAWERINANQAALAYQKREQRKLKGLKKALQKVHQHLRRIDDYDCGVVRHRRFSGKNNTLNPALADFLEEV